MYSDMIVRKKSAMFLTATPAEKEKLGIDRFDVFLVGGIAIKTGLR